MASVNSQPLTDDHRRLIDANLRKLNEVRQRIARCEKCNMDMADAESDRQYLEEQYTLLKQEFFGSYPPVNQAP